MVGELWAKTKSTGKKFGNAVHRMMTTTLDAVIPEKFSAPPLAVAELKMGSIFQNLDDNGQRNVVLVAHPKYSQNSQTWGSPPAGSTACGFIAVEFMLRAMRDPRCLVRPNGCTKRLEEVIMEAVNSGNARRLEVAKHSRAKCVSLDEVVKMHGCKFDVRSYMAPGNFNQMMTAVELAATRNRQFLVVLIFERAAIAVIVTEEYIFLMCPHSSLLPAYVGRSGLRFARFERPFRFSEEAAEVMNRGFNDYMKDGENDRRTSAACFLTHSTVPDVPSSPLSSVNLNKGNIFLNLNVNFKSGTALMADECAQGQADLDSREARELTGFIAAELLQRVAEDPNSLILPDGYTERLEAVITDAVMAGNTRRLKYHGTNPVLLNGDEAVAQCGLQLDQIETYRNLRELLVCVDEKSWRDQLVRIAVYRGHVAAAMFCYADFIFFFCPTWQSYQSTKGNQIGLRFARFKRPFLYTEDTCHILTTSLTEYMRRTVVCKTRLVID